jgi:hypothetical protein
MMYIYIIMRVTLSQELQEKVDRSAQTADVSKQTKLVEIIDSYFSDSSESDAPSAQSSTSPQSLSLPELLEDSLKEELILERERYNQLYEQFQYLQGEYALVTTKLLPAAARTMTPWWTRLIVWLKS